MKIDRLKIILLAVILTFIFLSPLDAFSSSGQYTLQVPIGSVSTVPVGAGSNPFGDYFKMWYGFIIGTVGILATIMIIVGGFQWLSSRGNSGAIKEGQDRIFSAIIGLGIAFLAYTILNLVNPGLTNLDINTSLLKTITYTDTRLAPNGGNPNGTSQSPATPRVTNSTNATAAGLTNTAAVKVPCPQANGGTDYYRAYTASYEGYDGTPYFDQDGWYTWGIGHHDNEHAYANSNSNPNGPSPTVDYNTETQWFQNNYLSYYNNAQSTFSDQWDSFSPARRAALADIFYQRGSLNGTDYARQAEAAIKAGDFNTAADLLLADPAYGGNSWSAVRQRAANNAEILRNDNQDLFTTQAQTACE